MMSISARKKSMLPFSFFSEFSTEIMTYYVAKNGNLFKFIKASAKTQS